MKQHGLLRERAGVHSVEVLSSASVIAVCEANTQDSRENSGSPGGVFHIFGPQKSRDFLLQHFARCGCIFFVVVFVSSVILCLPDF